MPEVGLGLALERFTLLAEGEEYGSIDIVDTDSASITLTALPEFPVSIRSDTARQLVEAWRKRAELEALPYEVREEQRAV